MPNDQYFDYNATTPVSDTVKQSYFEALDIFGNPSSLHQDGQIAKAALESARHQFAQSIETTPEHIIFTSSGSESNNHILNSLWRQSLQNKKNLHIITSDIEHSSVGATLQYLSQFGVKVTSLPVSPSGHIRLADIEAAITPDTRLISIMLANNEIGSIQPIADICELAHDQQILVHTDAIQALGKLSIAIPKLPVDFMTFSAHKIYAPKGTGALYIKNNTTITPFIYGGGHEQQRRAGTENVPGIIAFGHATTDLPNATEWQRQRSLLDYLQSQLKGLFPDLQIHSNHHTGLPNTLAIGIDGIDGHALAINLDLAGIGVSTGSACSTGSIEPSPVLTAIGVSDSLNKGSIRISIGKYTTRDACDVFIQEFNHSVTTMAQ